jgi:hypothetical protein
VVSEWEEVLDQPAKSTAEFVDEVRELREKKEGNPA